MVGSFGRRAWSTSIPYRPMSCRVPGKCRLGQVGILPVCLASCLLPSHTYIPVPILPLAIRALVHPTPSSVTPPLLQSPHPFFKQHDVWVTLEFGLILLSAPSCFSDSWVQLLPKVLIGSRVGTAAEGPKEFSWLASNWLLKSQFLPLFQDHT